MGLTVSRKKLSTVKNYGIKINVQGLPTLLELTS